MGGAAGGRREELRPRPVPDVPDGARPPLPPPAGHGHSSGPTAPSPNNWPCRWPTSMPCRTTSPTKRPSSPSRWRRRSRSSSRSRSAPAGASPSSATASWACSAPTSWPATGASVTLVGKHVDNLALVAPHGVGGAPGRLDARRCRRLRRRDDRLAHRPALGGGRRPPPGDPGDQEHRRRTALAVARSAGHQRSHRRRIPVRPLPSGPGRSGRTAALAHAARPGARKVLLRNP
jgi:hypothetical protein